MAELVRKTRAERMKEEGLATHKEWLRKKEEQENKNKSENGKTKL